MTWTLLLLTYAGAESAIPPAVTPYDIPFESEVLCEAARETLAATLPTKDVKVRTACVQTAE